MLVNIFKFDKDLQLYHSITNNLMIIKTFLGMGFFYLPSYYFYKNNVDFLSFIFRNNISFKSFIANFFTQYSYLKNLYIIRLKIKGLGYQIYKLSKTIYSFNFSSINFFYLLLPHNIVCHWFKKRFILISNNLVTLKTIFTSILLLKKLGPYRILGVKYPRHIISLKRGGKNKSK
jgi:hypothetical protein